MMTLKKILAALWALCWASLLLCSCSLELNQHVPECIDNLDCPLDQTCDLESRRCVPRDLPKPLSVIDLELSPQAGSGSAKTQIAGLDLKGVDTAELPLELATAVAMEGQVTAAKSDGDVAGSLVFTRSPDFDNRRLVWNTSTSEQGNFTSDLAPGSYDILVKPSEREIFPQLLIKDVIIPFQHEPDLSYPAFPASEGEDLDPQDPLLLVYGRVLQSQSLAVPVTGIKIEGVTAEGLRTAIAEPDEEGYFYLRLPVSKTNEVLTPADPQLPSLNLTIGPKSNEDLLPTLSVENLELDGPDLGTFFLGNVAHPSSFTGVVVDATGKPVADCQLRFHTHELGNGHFSYQSRTDTSGRFLAELPGAVYQVTVVPELLSAVSLAIIPLDLTENREQNIVLEDRPNLSGTILDDESHLVAEVIIRAQRLSAVNGVDDGVVRSYEGLSLEDGSFALAVDPGRYAVVFIPSLESGLPRSLPKPVYVTSDYPMRSSATRLAQPTVIQGHVFNEYGEPMCGVTIDVFYSDEENAYLIGQSISGTNQLGCTGAYAVIIPSNPFPTQD